MVTHRRLAALVAALALVCGSAYGAKDVWRALWAWRGSPHVIERSGDCELGAWSVAEEGPWPGPIRVRAGVLAKRSCEPVEIKVEATLHGRDEFYRLDTLPRGIRLSRWKVLTLQGTQNLRRGTVQGILDFSRIWGPLGPRDMIRVVVTARCKHGTTVVSDVMYWYQP